ncbi:MAG TPA: type I-C CRISPR-associated protein Cas5c [Planctomycetaceae bacterium]|nr:type I-C CRISPR-associated protein Cas5c [Planctomycetaceae bacterium]
MDRTVSVKVWAPYACFTRPELKVERLSYPLMTPLAARGVLEAILWLPQMRWHVRRITALRPWLAPIPPDDTPYWLVGVRPAEVEDKISSGTVKRSLPNIISFRRDRIDPSECGSAGNQRSTRRNTLALRNVAYQIEASIFLTATANQSRVRDASPDETQGPDTVAKYIAMFRRRIKNGHCFDRPYLGCREFACSFGPTDGSEQAIPWTDDLGMMLYDLRYGPGGSNTPGFFAARVLDGTLHCDTLGPGRRGEPPIWVHGWPEISSAEAAE